MGLHIGDCLEVGNGAGLPTLIAYTDEELIVIAVVDDGTDWSNQKWSPDGDIRLHLVGRIRYLKSLWPDVEFICMFWNQCEADTVP
ncbi:hypothetical protein LSAT2_001160, partial [Lamellibrachia satsuma]